ncbi:dynein light chain roadblock-type 1-like [Drosophila miranda]|uniref:dynein light chain roadblock-type 1-like n=1 Tax=Drosophila miranda TaxID=7229 RepID=UPI00143F4BFB|nr:dynein light chain roadblock-type 1-like [Drosophila miranda]
MQAAETEPKRTKSYIDEVYRLLEEKPGVEEILIMNRSGVPIKTSMERQDALQHACLYENFREKCQAFLSKMEPPQLLTMLRVRTRFHEVLLTPDGKITVLVVQNPKDTHLKVEDLNRHSSNF